MLVLEKPRTEADTAPSSSIAAATGAFNRSVMHSATRMLKRKEHVFFEGDLVTHIYKVEAGHVCIYRLLADGRRQVVDFAFPGDFIGLGATGRHAMNAQATEPTRLRCLSVSELGTVMAENPKFGLELYEAISRELDATRELLMSVSH
ncbi:MAG: Crp/Fnr family transcriptional regulator, partial [Alphaproteobacteria bacterium]|nr:Crp/Fnr family transcriptional regulator [Alphaproteobacteria bacterium]